MLGTYHGGHTCLPPGSLTPKRSWCGNGVGRGRRFDVECGECFRVYPGTLTRCHGRGQHPSVAGSDLACTVGLQEACASTQTSTMCRAQITILRVEFIKVNCSTQSITTGHGRAQPPTHTGENIRGKICVIDNLHGSMGSVQCSQRYISAGQMQAASMHITVCTCSLTRGASGLVANAGGLPEAQLERHARQMTCAAPASTTTLRVHLLAIVHVRRDMTSYYTAAEWMAILDRVYTWRRQQSSNSR